MYWADGSDIDIKQHTGESLCTVLADVMGKYSAEEWLGCADFIQDAYFLIAFDTELTMEGIFTFLENSIGHYAPNIIKAFRAIGDNRDADVLAEICRIAPPDLMRGEFLDKGSQVYEISSFSDDHELTDEAADRIEALSDRLYLKSGLDIWALLFQYLDKQIEMCKE